MNHYHAKSMNCFTHIHGYMGLSRTNIQLSLYVNCGSDTSSVKTCTRVRPLIRDAKELSFS